MKKDKEWLLHEIRKLPCEVQYGHGKIKAVDILPLIDQLDEPGKVVVPKFIAEWYEKNKKDLEYEIYAISNHISNRDYSTLTEMEVWFNDNSNKPIETLIKMKLFGYEVEKEKLYQVIIPTKDAVWECYYLDHDGRLEVASNSKYADSHTEKFIRSISDDLWHFAVEVTK